MKTRKIVALIVAFAGVLIAGYNGNVHGLLGVWLVGMAAPFYFLHGES